MAFIEPFLSRLDKWIIDYPSKRYGPFLDIRRGLLETKFVLLPKHLVFSPFDIFSNLMYTELNIQPCLKLC